MDSKQAIEELNKLIPKNPDYNDKNIALTKAIKVLEQEPIKDEIILTKKEYRELLSSEFDNGYSKGYREVLKQEQNAWDKIKEELEEYKIIGSQMECFGTTEENAKEYIPIDIALEIINKHLG